MVQTIRFYTYFSDRTFVYFCHVNELQLNYSQHQMSDKKTYNVEKYFLLSAEAFCAEVLSNGISFDELVINFRGSFAKSYSNDIATVEEGRGRSESLVVSVNRDGIYDKMPEGLFHQTKGGSNTSALSAMVGEYKRYREEERQARKFFQPLEQEIFRYAIAAEQKEREIRAGILNGNIGTAFLDFWNIDKSLPSRPSAALVLIMPWIKQIKGNSNLTAKALSMMLEKPVTITSEIAHETSRTTNTFCLDTNASLGNDTICGSKLYEPIEQWVFTMHDMLPKELSKFTSHEPYGLFLQKFEELFIPLEVDVKFNYEYSSKADVTAEEQVLGYGYCL